MTTDAAIKLKAAKDSLVASLFELSKASNQTASSIVDFYNNIGEDEDEKLEAFTTLTEALQNLTSSTNSLNGITSELVNPAEDEKETTNNSPPTPVKPTKKKAEKDPNAPKKPLTVFFAYSAYVRQELRDARQMAGLPPLSSTEITQEISKKWKDLSDAEKETWKKAYNVELGHYQKAKLEYLEAKKNGTLPPPSAGPKQAPVPIPYGLIQHDNYQNKRPHDDDSSEKKKKKKKKDKKKERSN